MTKYATKAIAPIIPNPIQTSLGTIANSASAPKTSHKPPPVERLAI
jgi:hypothetical protein